MRYKHKTTSLVIALDPCRSIGVFSATAAAHLHLHWCQSLFVPTLTMATQVDLALERLIAKAAAEWLVAGVFAHVCDEIGALAESFQANGAFVRLFTCKMEGNTKKKPSINKLIKNKITL